MIFFASFLLEVEFFISTFTLASLFLLFVGTVSEYKLTGGIALSDASIILMEEDS
mgnify:CR=1 FL=1